MDNNLKNSEVLQYDKLTGLPSRQMGEARIREVLASEDESISGFLLIDVDEFSRINSEYGYIFGDSIMRDMSSVIVKCAGENAICVRANIDVFIVFLPDYGRKASLLTADRICKETKALYSEEQENINISCSIGISSSAISKDYTKLLTLASSTLAYVKRHKKGSYGYYLDFSEETGEAIGYEKAEPNRKMDYISNSRNIDDIVSYSFIILEQSKDTKTGMKMLMSRIGKQYKLDTIAVFRTDRIYHNSSSVYYWNASNAHDFLSSFDYRENEILDEYIKAHEDNHYYEITDINVKNLKLTTLTSELHPIEKPFSILSFDNYSGGRFIGYTLFGTLDERRCWTAEEIGDFSEVSKIISSYIEKVDSDTASHAKSDFLSHMSHEIRTPMNAILGMTSITDTLLRTYMQDNGIPNTVEEADAIDGELSIFPRITGYLQKIDNSTRYLLSLINDILDMSKIEDGKMNIVSETVDINKVLENVSLVINQQAQTKKVGFLLNVNLEHPVVMSDELRLTQTIINLAGNAVKFTPEGGKIEITVDEIDFNYNKARYNFSIKDNGIGISPENLDKIFKPFEQATEQTVKAYGGSGLGLTISSTMVRLMGGELKCESKLGEGSCFSFSLVLNISEKELEKNLISGKEDYDFSGRRVLLAEDNELNAEIAGTLLEMVNLEVETAVDGQNAFDKFMSYEPGHFDMILMDIRMPVMDGLEATRHIRRSGRDDAAVIPIVAMSANAFEEDVNKSLECGMNEHLSKPIDVKILYSTLDKYFNNGGTK